MILGFELAGAFVGGLISLPVGAFLFLRTKFGQRWMIQQVGRWLFGAPPLPTPPPPPPTPPQP